MGDSPVVAEEEAKCFGVGVGIGVGIEKVLFDPDSDSDPDPDPIQLSEVHNQITFYLPRGVRQKVQVDWRFLSGCSNAQWRKGVLELHLYGMARGEGMGSGLIFVQTD